MGPRKAYTLVLLLALLLSLLTEGLPDFSMKNEVTAITSWSDSPSTTELAQAHEVIAIDSRNDGEIQLLVTIKDGQNLYWLTHGTSGDDQSVIEEDTKLSVTVPSNSGNILGKVKAVAVGQITDDDYPDLMLADEGDGGRVKAMQNSHGTFGFTGFDAPLTLDGGCKKIINLRVVDLDGDGCNDVIAACKDDNTPGFYRQNCMSGQSTSTINIGWTMLNGDRFVDEDDDMKKIFDIDSGDFDGDGQRDLVIVMDDDKSVGVIIFLLNEITGSSWSTKQVLTPTQDRSASSFTSGISHPDKIASIAICDADNDGDLDVFLLWKHGDTVGYLQNQGGIDRGWLGFAPPVSVISATTFANSNDYQSEPRQVLCRDMDADGSPDLIIANKWVGVQMLKNDGTGDFSSSTLRTYSSIEWYSSEKVSVADLNNDGMLDIMFGDPDTNAVHFIFNDAKCNVGYFMDMNKASLHEGGVCTPCPAGRYTSVAGLSTECLPCQAGRFSAQVGPPSYPCVVCNDNTISSTGAEVCTDCSAAKVSNSQKTACIRCSSGKYITSSESNRECALCQAGRYSIRGTTTTGTCDVCGVDTFSPSGAASCGNCGTNKFANAESASCTACGGGTRFDVDPSSNVRSCQDCDGGKYITNEMQSGLVTFCSVCNENEFSSSGATACESCPSGKMSTPGSQACELCRAGTYMLYVDEENAFRCAPCAAGKYSDKQASSTCEICPENTFSPTGAASCQECEAGKVSFAASAECMEPCSPGFYISTTTLLCLECNPGTYSDDGKTCESCEMGKYGPYNGLTSIDSCLDCEKGYYTVSSASTYCRMCEAGKFQPVLGGTTCLPCDEGKSSGPGSSDCSGIYVHKIVPDLGNTRGNETIVILGTKLDESYAKIGNKPCETLTEISNATHLFCLLPPGAGKDKNVLITKNDGSGNLLVKGAFSYKAPTVERVRGCGSHNGGNSFHSASVEVDGETTGVEQGTKGCPTVGRRRNGEQVVITIKGNYFGNNPNDISVQVGGRSCLNLKLEKPHVRISCHLPFGTGEHVTVSVSVQEQIGISSLLSYHRPSVVKVSGCRSDAENPKSAVDCPRTGGEIITVLGSNFGPSEPIVMVGGVACERLTSAESYDQESQDRVMCTLPAGSGSLKSVNIIQINGLISDRVNLVSYKKCPAGYKNAPNDDLGYFECVMCESGKYSTNEESFQCTTCLAGSYTDGPTVCNLCASQIKNSISTRNEAVGIESCVCPAKSFFNPHINQDGECISCDTMRGVDCSMPGQSLESLQLKPGYWRSSLLSTNVVRCYKPEACIGAVNKTKGEVAIVGAHNTTAAANYCAKGYEGPYCNVCQEGYSGSFGSCRKCKRQDGSIAWSISLIALLVLFVLFLGRKISSFTPKSKKVLIIGGKLFVSTIQILMAIPQVFEVVLPENFVTFLSFFNIFNFSFIEIFDIGCSVRVTAYHLMISATVVPLVCCVPILGMWVFHY